MTGRTFDIPIHLALRIQPRETSCFYLLKVGASREKALFPIRKEMHQQAQRTGLIKEDRLDQRKRDL